MPLLLTPASLCTHPCNQTQCFAEQLAKGAVPEDLIDTGINPAAFEIAGHMLLKRQEVSKGE